MLSRTDQQVATRVAILWYNERYKRMHKAVLDESKNISPKIGHKSMISLVRLAGIEPTTLGFGGQYSIH